MDSNIKSNTSFWSEISDYKIQVPYYQRDYAQGRIDNGRIDNIRKVFVEEMYGAIMGFNNKECHLGLVFGSYDKNEKTFIAVDGQQRLTTVFLLHWYVAWRENKLNDYKEKLLNFSWDTRSYSSQFVELLFKIRPSGNVIDSIKTNSNYFSVWENDPTVKGMLTMLEEIEKQYPNDILLCSQLFSNDCKIKYDILKLEKDSDGKTYLKMNSRGRSLTTFELFKSKLLDKYKPNFGHKFDNEWLSYMIETSATSDSQFSDPDIPFMNFINEYTYLQLKLELKSGSDIANDYKEFTDAKVKGELTDVPFISFDKYNDAFEGDRLEYFEKSLDWICQNYENIKLIDNKIRFSDSRFFIDAIIKDNNPNFTHRAKLFAVFRYAELTGYAQIDTELYKKWTRVFRNLVANTDIDASNIGGICKAINKIDNSDIYGYLSKGGEITAFAKDQVKEERDKVKQMLDGNGGPRKYDGKYKKEDGSTFAYWEDIIIHAEENAFFKGTIRFLFQSAEGIVTEDSWRLFDKKWENVKKYFDENGVKDFDKKYKSEAILLKAVLYHVEDFWKYIEPQKFVLDNTASTWKNRILLEHGWEKAVHKVLMGELDVPERNEDCLMYRNLYKTNLLNYVANEQIGSRIRWHHGHRTVYPPRYDGIMLDDDHRDKPFYRNSILSSLRDITSSQRIKDKPFYKGWDINFKYNSYDFQWNTDGNVYLIENNDRKKDENGLDYLFSGDGINDANKFEDELDSLIKKVQQNGNLQSTHEQ
jgi:hypothetical protein